MIWTDGVKRENKNVVSSHGTARTQNVKKPQSSFNFVFYFFWLKILKIFG